MEIVPRIFGSQWRRHIPTALLVLGRRTAHFAREKSASRGTVSVEGNVVLTQDREEAILSASANGVVLALIDRWFDVAVLLADLEDFFNFFNGVVGEAEALKLAIEKSIVHSLACVFKGCGPIGSVKVHDIDRVGVKCFEGSFNTSIDILGTMAAGHET